MVFGEKRTRITYGLPGSLGLPCTTAIARPGTTGLATHLMSTSRTMFMTSAGGSASTANEALHASAAYDTRIRFPIAPTFMNISSKASFMSFPRSVVDHPENRHFNDVRLNQYSGFARTGQSP